MASGFSHNLRVLNWQPCWQRMWMTGCQCVSSERATFLSSVIRSTCQSNPPLKYPIVNGATHKLECRHMLAAPSLSTQASPNTPHWPITQLQILISTNHRFTLNNRSRASNVTLSFTVWWWNFNAAIYYDKPNSNHVMHRICTVNKNGIKTSRQITQLFYKSAPRVPVNGSVWVKLP